MAINKTTEYTLYPGQQPITSSTGEQNLTTSLESRVVWFQQKSEATAVDLNTVTEGKVFRVADQEDSTDFTVKLGDYSTEVSLDPDQAIWVSFDDYDVSPGDKGALRRNTNDLYANYWGNDYNSALDYIDGSIGDAFAKGGELLIDRGVNTVSSEILLDRTDGGTDTNNNISIRGQGFGTSELRGSGLSGGENVIKTNQPSGNPIQCMKLENISTRNGFNGVRIETASRTSLRDLKVEAATESGVYVGNSWVNVYENILTTGNGLHGVEFASDLQKTSTSVIGGYALVNAASGWKLGFMNYSSVISPASDRNVHHGYVIENSDGLFLSAPGAETNGRAGIFAYASSSAGSNDHVVIEGAFMFENNQSNSGWANLLHARSENGENNHITIRNSKSLSPVGSTADIIAEGEGTVVTVDNCETPNNRLASNGGYFDWVHHSLRIPQINFGAGAARAVCKIRSTQGYSGSYGGTITVHASDQNTSTSVRRTATYHLLVCKTGSGGREVVETAKAGETDGSASDRSPSFTWSIDGVENLVATAVTGTINGDFWFEVTTGGQVVAYV